MIAAPSRISCSVYLLLALFLVRGVFEAAGPPLLHAQTRPVPAAKRAQTYDPALLNALRFRSIGPARGGRVTTVTGITEQPYTFYMGSTGGGVWRTEDAGQSWINVSDGALATGSIGAVQVADSDPKTIYVGTGSDGIRSNVITGRGVYKSTDGAKSWTFVGLREAGQIGAVEIHPTDPERVYVAAIGHPFGKNRERGVYRTTDGGGSWKRVLFVSDSTGAVDLELEPGNPDVVYAAMWRAERKPWTIISGARGEGGIYRSTDGGDTWAKLEGGLPRGLIGKIDLAISPARPERVYALVEAPGAEGGLYRSEDRGEHWTLINPQSSLLNRPFYYTNVDADPRNSDIVYVNNETFWKSVDAGKTFKAVSTPHVDNHDMWINPRDPDIFIQSNDGGVNVTLNGGRSWSTQYNQPTAEIYQVAVDDRFPYRVFGAQQDNTTLMVPSLPPVASLPDLPEQLWQPVSGCETGPVVPHPTNPDVVYGGCKGRFSRIDLRTGQERQYWVGAEFMYGHNPRDLRYRFQRTAPIEVSPHDPRVIYHGSQYVHRTTDEGLTWETISPDLTANDPARQVIAGEPISRDITGEEFYSTLYALRESPLERGVLWAGANDGPVHVSRDGGQTWTDVTPSKLPPGGRVQTIEPSPHRRGSAYIAVYRYLLDDWQPYLYRTDDYGRSWARLTNGRNGIPADHPVRVVREDPEREGLLYAGTEFGMFVSWDNGRRWQPLQLNLPVTPVTDMSVHRGDLVLSTMGRGFWILDDIAPLREFTPAIARAPVHLFQPRDAFRIRYGDFGERPSMPEYPPPGAMIDYALGADAAGPIELEIRDARGALVRRFTGAEPATLTVRTDSLETPEPTWEVVGIERLPATRGMHRFIWDLRYPGAWNADPKRRGRGGPVVPPGRYEARLRVGDRTLTRPLEVRMDPRVIENGVSAADVAVQTALNLRIRDAISDARRAAARIAAERTGVSTNGGDAARAAQLAAIEAQLVTAEGRYPQRMLVDQLEYLYGMTTGADQRPGRDAVERYEELRAELNRHLTALRGIGIEATVPVVSERR